MTTTGVQFPIDAAGVRSTTEVARRVVADALRVQRPEWADQALTQKGWRGAYLTHFRRLQECASSSPDAWRGVASAGLASVQRQMVAVDEDGAEAPVTNLLEAVPTAKLRSVTVTGEGAPAPLGVPYRGELLTGAALVAQLQRWSDAGVVEPGVVRAIETVADNPAWLALPGRVVAVLGVGSEMGPASTLLSWGATVAAVDRPGPAAWTRVIDQARGSAGTLLLPVADHAEVEHGDTAGLAAIAGGCLLSDVPELAQWLGDQDGDLVLGNYTYADGGTHVQLSVAGHLLAQRLRSNRPETALAFLATPTDTFTVPASAVDHARAQYRSRGVLSTAASAALRTVSRGALLAPAYSASTATINDALVPVQGPNYAFAKRLQRWAAVAARAEGATVSMNVAPSTRTRSVVKNRALAAAYAGAHHFGVEIFEPDTTNALMAALLVHDLNAFAPNAAPSWVDEARHAVHGGLWRAPYEPRSALNLAAVLGAPSLLGR